MALVIQSLIFITLFYVLLKTIRFYIFSPIYAYVFFIVIVIVLTLPYYYFYEPKISLYKFDNVSTKDFLNTIKLYLISLNAFLVGALVYYFFSTKNTRVVLFTKPKIDLRINLELGKKFRTFCIGFVIFLIISFLFLYKETIFFREIYLPKIGYNALLSVHKVLSLIACILLAILNKTNGKSSKFLFLLLVILYLGTGSRMVFLFLVLYIVISFFNSRKTLLRRFWFVTQLLFSFFFFAYLIQLRSLEYHGIIPYLANIPVLGSGIIEKSIFNIYYTFIFGVFVTIQTINESVVDWYIIVVNLNPLPGSIAGWYDYAASRRLNRFAPYSLHGEVFSMGITFSIFFFTLIGIFFSFLEKKIKQRFISKSFFQGFILVVILYLHIFYSFEYNMRSSLRYIYYAFFYLFVLFLIRKIVLTIKRRYRVKT
ncbi:O-antigen polymerase [uncultured Dokdonia sp.]|uniref:O-antigen polymerase n=1 Tax=uncultured Dokdonia sp. TaxID=575653 RepID=UPI00261F67BE|nr:O-antigen polymerase [uncultured Dokdonia sp.]